MSRTSTTIEAASQTPSPVSQATADGTARYEARFERKFEPNFYRTTSFGVTVSSIGLGTYLGDSTDEDDTAYEQAIQHAIESGVNLIDTAINYRSQRSERAIGAAIEHLCVAGRVARDELVVCSKGGYIPLDRHPPETREAYQRYVREEFIDQQIVRPEEIVGGGHSLAPRFLRYCLAKSRQNLGLRTIDIYYVHNPGQLLSSISRDDLFSRLRGAFAVLEEAASRRDIGVYGCASWDELRVASDAKGHLALEDLVAIAREVGGEDHHFRVVQAPVNLAMLEAVRNQTQPLGGHMVTLVEAAQALGIMLIGSASLLQGRLTSGVPAELRSHFPRTKTDAQRAIAFVRALPGITSALVGMKEPKHVDENLEAAREG